MQYELHMTERQLGSLIEHAENALPFEAVSLLFGKTDGSIVRVDSVRPVENVAEEASTSFFVEPEVQYKIMMEEEARGRAMICIFHSHPAPVHPSSRDLRNMKLNPTVWLIASKTTGTWKTGAFVLVDDAPSEVPIIIEDS